MPESENKAIVSAAFDAWAHGDRDFYNKILADDVNWTITGSSPLAGAYTSRQDFLERAIRPIFERLSEPIRPTVEAIVSEGDTVVVLWRGRAVANDGVSYDNRYCSFLKMDGGRVKEAVAFFDAPPLTDLLERVSPATAPA